MDTLRDTITGAFDANKRKMRAQAAGDEGQPDWITRTRMKMGAPPGSQYEEGDPDIDAFNKKRHTGGPDQDDPYQEGYQSQEEFQRLMHGAFNAGLNADNGALDAFPPNTPIGKLMRRAFQEGQQRRNGQGGP